MPEPTPGRNDPCSCGSGKKYKKCCMSKAATARETLSAPRLSPKATVPDHEWDDDEKWDRLDEVSNSAVDAIREKLYEKAEKICEQLLRDYPEIFDGYDRLAMLREAQGRYREAADHYASALDLIKRHQDDHEPELVKHFEKRRQEALQKAALP
jgi:tetratricopeptide (TPR) repeat protein